MAATNQQVLDFLLSSPNLSDADIYSFMQEKGVSASQISNVTGVPISEISSRVEAIAPQNVLGGTILAGDSWLAGEDKTAIAKEAFGEDVTNVAVGGFKTQDALDQLNSFLNKGGVFKSGSTVVLDIGGNDLLQGVSRNTVKSNIDQMLKIFEREGVKVVLSGAPAVGSVSDVTSSTNLKMDSLYKEVAQGYDNVTVVDAMSGLLNSKTYVDESGFHVNAKGQTEFLNQLASATNTKSTPTEVVAEITQPQKDLALTTENINQLAAQILAQNTTGAWSGGLPPETAALYMASDLAKSGVTNINQVGKGTDGIINKLTGEKLVSGYGERTKGNLWSGSYSGKGNTGFGVEFDEAGKPVFFTQGASSSTLKKDLLKLAAVAGVVYGVGGFEGLFGTAAPGATALTAAETAGTVAGMGAGTGLTAGAAGLGINAAGTAGLGTLGTGAGITAGAGLTGTGILSGSTLGTALLGTGAGLAGLTGTGLLSGSTLGTELLGTTGTGSLTGTGILTGSDLGTQLLGTGAGTAATVGGVTGLTNAANVGLGALNTGVTTGLTGLGAGALNTGVNVSGAGTGVGTGTVGGTGVGTGVGTGTGTNLGNLTAAQVGSLLSGGLTTGAGLLQQQTSKEAAQRAQAMIDAETAAAKQAAAFRPIGMTTRFGTSQFAVDPVTGQLTSAGYTLSPEAKAQQDRFMALSNAGLTQAEQAQAQFAPLQTGAQNLFNLGNQYLAQSPESVAQNYLNQQMALLQPGRELELANLQNRLQQQGRGGLSVAQGGTMGATTPELQALYNARAQQEAVLAANAQQAGQQQVLYGAGLLGQGTTAMGNYYAGQQAAYAPYTTAMGQVTGLEALGQQPLTTGAALGQQAAQAGANVGRLGLSGAEFSTRLATGPAATNNPYASLLSGTGSSPVLTEATAKALLGLFS
jgi:hypothetical protein